MMPVSVSVNSLSKFNTGVNGDGHFKWQNGSRPHSDAVKMFFIDTVLNFDTVVLHANRPFILADVNATNPLIGGLLESP